MSFSFQKRRTSENHAGQGIDLDPKRTHLHEQRWRGVQLTVFWSRAQHQHHMTTNLMKLAVGERNVANNLGINSRLCRRMLF